eukprot:SAG11_NODE_2679_length_3104_cov_3.342429_3_plen_127_part_00
MVDLRQNSGGLVCNGAPADEFPLTIAKCNTHEWEVELSILAPSTTSILSLTCDLKTAKWAMRPVHFQCQPATRAIECKSAKTWLSFFVDSAGFLCLRDADGLPAASALAAAPLHPSSGCVVAVVAF